MSASKEFDDQFDVIRAIALDIVEEIRATHGVVELASGPAPVFELTPHAAANLIIGLATQVSSDQTFRSVLHILKVAQGKVGE